MNLIEFFIKCGFVPVEDNVPFPMYKLEYGGNNYYVDSSDSYWKNMTIKKLFEEVIPHLVQQDFSQYMITKARAIFIDEILYDLG